MNERLQLGRRAVLAGAGLVVVVRLPLANQAEAAEDPAQLGAFIRIGRDGGVTVVTPCFELGQGSTTGLAMIVADELGADWSRVTIQAPPLDPGYRTPGRPVQSTSGSQMVRRWFAPLRKSAAAARVMLTEAAARRWSVDPASCTASNGTVNHGASGRNAPFGELAAAAAKLPQPENPPLRTSFTIVGTPARRFDIPAKVDGSARFGIDVRVPGMTYAAIRQAPVFGAKLVSVDDAGLRGRRGVIDIVKLPEAVAVVADSFWRAKTAVEALDAVFSDVPPGTVSSKQIAGQRQARLAAAELPAAIESGNAPAALAAFGKVIAADFDVPFLYHAPMEPMTCTAHVTDTRCELWIPTQNLTTAAETAARVSGLPAQAVIAHATLAGGAFGRKFEQDFVAQAVAISKAVKRPVQLIWSREEDVQHDFYRPAISARLSAALTDAGDVAGMVIRLVGPSIVEHTIGTPLVKGADPAGLLGISTETSSAPGKLQQYAIGNIRVEFAFQPTHVPVGYWRAVGASHNGFFIETFVDELAAAAGKDPYEFRRRLLKDSPRALATLDKAAAEAGWSDKLPEGRYRGIAFSECVGSFVAQVAEVSLQDGVPRVHRIVGAIDCGTAINPDSVVAQMQGCITMGVSAALKEEITIEDGRVGQSNFHDYEVLRMAEAPRIEVHVIQSGGEIGGAGEAGLPATAPAIANALFAATGKRARSLPLRGFA